MQHAIRVPLPWCRCYSVPRDFNVNQKKEVMRRGYLFILTITVLFFRTEAGFTDFETPSKDWFSALFRDAADWTLHSDGITNRKPFKTIQKNQRRGNFLLFSTSGSASNGKSAILESKILRSANRGSCVSFWYRIFGQDAGVLELKRVEATGTDLLWMREGNQKKEWKFAKVAIPNNSNVKYYQLIFEANIGSDGSMALDNIDLDENQPCTNSLENGGFAVDFETKVTSMKNKIYGDHFDWFIKKSRTSMQVPPTDVTSGIGHYLLLTTNGKRYGQRASYVSNGISRSYNGACLSFYFSISGQRAGKLTVSILSKSGWVSTATVLWSKTGNQSSGWHFAKFSLPKNLTSQKYDVMFTGTVGTSNSGSIAIDDVTLTNTGDC